MHIRPNLAPIVTAHERADPGRHRGPVRVAVVVDLRPVRQIEAHEGRIRRAQDRGVEIRRRVLDQPRDIGRAPGGLQPLRRAQGKPTLVDEKP